MDFSIDSFKKTPIIEPSADWIKTPTTRALYNETMLTFSRLMDLVKNGKCNSVFDHKIVARKVAITCGLSPSIISVRRQPEIFQLIQSLNEELEATYKSLLAANYTSGRKMSRQELLSENKQLKSEIKRLSNLKLSDAMAASIDSLLSRAARDQAKTIRKLKDEINSLEKTIDNQAIMLNDMIDTV
ncbi:hypothetical protein NQ186_11650 [Pseudomonas zeae]|uniref:hypothetical protein n=1 Tax=Pseudomonas zeae TaxID=2745510 RepID=UPI0021479C8D|nr:hypothetical protein [Pseudomonas zeae]UUT14793.1 hypothetical protein NQ186_11650 [Pseudomonas zeae]